VTGLALAPAPVQLAVGWRAGKGRSGGHLAGARGAGARGAGARSAGAGGARSAWGSGDGGQAVEEQAQVAAAQFAGAGRVGHADRGAALQHQAEVVGHHVRTQPARGLGANLALRDARRLLEQLSRASRGEIDLVDGIGSFEQDMRDYVYPFMRMTMDHDRNFGGGALERQTN